MISTENPDQLASLVTAPVKGFSRSDALAARLRDPTRMPRAVEF
jgi:hypothetical protein